MFERAHPEAGIAPNCEIVPALAELVQPSTAAGRVHNLGLAHEPGFEWTEVAPGPAAVSADWTML